MAAATIGIVLSLVVGISWSGPAASASVSAVSSADPATESVLGAFPALPTGKLPEETAAALQAVIDEAVQPLDVPGIAAAVIVADQGTWVGAAGTADGTAPLDPAAQFGIGSVTKTITAAQVLQLVESGAVDLDRPIADYVGDDLPTNGATVREVLGMRSGIGEVQVDPQTFCPDLAVSVPMAELREVPLGDPYFEPGERFRYTSANYVLAGILIEEVTGSSVARALRSGVLSAPGLERLIYQDEERPTAPLAAPFVVLPGSREVPPPQDLLAIGGGYLPARCLASSAGPAGGMAADAMTLARWGYLLYGGWVLGDEALAAMTDFEDAYGLGAHDQHSRFGVPALGHEGTVPGYTAQLLVFPDDGLAVAVLMNTNGDEGDLTTLAGALREALAP
jgi:D-alanyl-D-alanine carboxypeptidase